MTLYKLCLKYGFKSVGEASDALGNLSVRTMQKHFKNGSDKQILEERLRKVQK